MPPLLRRLRRIPMPCAVSASWDWVNSSIGDAPGEPGRKMLTLVASALAGGETTPTCRQDGWPTVVKAPSTLGTFLRSFRWGQVRQLDRVSRKLLAAAGAPGDAPFSLIPPRLARRGRATTY